MRRPERANRWHFWHEGRDNRLPRIPRVQWVAVQDRTTGEVILDCPACGHRPHRLYASLLANGYANTVYGDVS